MSALFLIMAMLADPLRDPCRDDDMVNRCSAAKQTEVRALYRVPPIESYAGATVRRVFFVDGYGNDTVAIEFIRAPEKDPLVRVHFPNIKEERPIAPIEQVLGSEQWQQLIDASKNFDKQFAPAVAPKRARKNKEEGEDIVLCLHSWVYWAEAIDEMSKTRSTVNDACNDTPVEQFAWAAARIAIGAFPFCNAIDPKQSRNDATRLRDCARLTGDRLSSAAVFNDANGFRSIARPGGIDDLAYYDFALDFQGAKTKGELAQDYWATQMKNLESPAFFVDRIHGVSPRKAVVHGNLIKMAGDDKFETAEVEMNWDGDGGAFRLTSMTVNPFRPFVPPNE